jgi:nitrogen fixation protein FixH
MSAKLRWIVAIIALLGGNVVAMVILMVSSSAHGGAQVIPDYYERAAHYDRTIDQEAANRALGWNVAVAGRRVTVSDASGHPIDGVTLAGYPRAHAAQRFETRDGQVPASAHGWLDVTVTAERGRDRFVQQVTVEAP